MLLGAWILAGCGVQKTPVVDDSVVISGTQETGMMVTWNTEISLDANMMEEVTWAEIQTTVTTSGTESPVVDPEISTEVKTLIQERQQQPKDDSKLTEEDIDLMEQIIQKIQGLGK